MNIAFNGIGEVMATFLASDGVHSGTPVKITSNGTVDACSAGDAFIGIALEPRDGATAVQVGGFVTVSCANGCPNLGRVTLAADGAGGIKTVSSGGVSVLVVATDTSAMTAVIYL